MMNNPQIDRTSELNNRIEGVYSSTCTHEGNILIGTLVFNVDPSVNFFDINYLDKYVAEDTHPSGYMKNEHRKQTKNRILISRFIDRAIRPIIETKRGFQIVIRLVNADKKIPAYKAALKLASDLLLQANLISEEIVLSEWSWNDYCEFFRVCTYKGGITTIEASLSNKPISDIERLLNEHDKSFNITKNNYSYKERILRESKNQDVLLGYLYIAWRIFKKSYFENQRNTLNSELKNLIREAGENVKFWIWRFLSLIYKSLGRHDGRAFDQIRPLKIITNIIPKPFASVLVERGKTKVLTSLTTSEEPQSIDEVQSFKKEEFLNIQYDMIPSAVGEVGRIGIYSRREIGHANLVYNAIVNNKVHSQEALFIQNDVVSCAGSSSMASVIGTACTMAMTGNIKSLVSGITVGAINSEDLIVDIEEWEDWMGLMDLKVAGSESGITAIQMDVKYMLPDSNRIIRSLELAYSSILKIISKMNESLSNIEVKKINRSASRHKEIALFHKDLIKSLIGFEGANFKRIVKDFDVKIILDKEQEGDKDGNIKLQIIGEETAVNSALKALREITIVNQMEVIGKIVNKVKDGIYLFQPFNSISGYVLTSKNLNIQNTIRAIFDKFDDRKRVIYRIVEDSKKE